MVLELLQVVVVAAAAVEVAEEMEEVVVMGKRILALSKEWISMMKCLVITYQTNEL